MRIISLSNQKGGTAKTTTTANLGGGLVSLGKKVLLIDLDSQANLSTHLGFDPRHLQTSISDLLSGNIGMDKAIYGTKTPNLDIIPSTRYLADVAVELVNVKGREVVLKKFVSGITGYDFILIDCPPSLGVLTLNAFIASNEIIIPLQVEFFAFGGMVELFETISQVKQELNKDLEVLGILPVRFDVRKNVSHAVVNEVNSKFQGRVFKTIIRENVKLVEAPSFGMTIFDYAPSSYGAEDYLEFAKEVIKHGKD